MKDKKSIIDIAKHTIEMEGQAILNLSSLITDDFADATQLIYNSKGRVIITGIGKSAIIANKIVATLNSTGTPAIFMHAADAIHGDLGLILEDDVVICISKSGNTPEIKVLVPLIKSAKNKTKLLCGAGIVSGQDVAKALELGSKGILVASGIIKAKNWTKIIEEFSKAMN